MLRSTSSLRSLLHLLRPPNPSLPSSPLSTRSRFLSSTSPTPGGARWATYDCDRLIDSLCASASASDTPVDSDIWATFDPVAGRIVIQRPPRPPSTTEEEEEEKGEGAGDLEDEEKAGVKGKGRWKGWASASGEKGQTGRPSAAARKSEWKGYGGKGSVSYMCINCGEFHSQWWGICRYCNAARTLEKCRDMVLQGDGDPSKEEGEEGAGAGKHEDEKKAGVNGEGASDLEDVEKAGVKLKGKGKGKGWASASGEKGRAGRPSAAAARKSARKGNGGKGSVSYMCINCGEFDSQWWGSCRCCKAVGTFQKCRDVVLQGDGDPSKEEEEEEEGEGAGECEDEEKAGVKGNERVKGKWKRKREGQGKASGERGRTSRPSDTAAQKSSKERVSYVCSHCGEGHLQWWSCCRYCNILGTLQRSREMVPQSLQEVN